MAQLRIKRRDDPALRNAARMLQMIKLGLAELQHEVGTSLVGSKAEGLALGQALLAHVRDPDQGLDRFRHRERASWRLVQAVLERAGEQPTD